MKAPKPIPQHVLDLLPLDVVRLYSTVTPSGCWEWNRATGLGGYALQAHTYVHRIVCTHVYGPSDLNALHSCDNPPCVNPAHLRWGTQAENMQDRDARRLSVLRASVTEDMERSH